MYTAIIIEDDPVIAQLNSIYLDSYKEINLVSSFRNGTDAITYLKNNKTDLILLDYHLPGMNGSEFMANLREIDSHAEVIVITIDNETSAVRSLLNYGVIDYLIKPYSYERYHSAISHFMDKAASIKNSSYISQSEIDRFLSNKGFRKTSASENPEKGIQQETHEQLITYLKKHIGEPLTIDNILNDIPLSRVTIRRYMKYYSKEGIVSVKVNHSTGGRPSMIYTYKE